MIDKQLGLNDLSDEQNNIINKLAHGQGMSRVLEELNIKPAVCKKWLKENAEFKIECRDAISYSKEPAPPPSAFIPGRHGGYATGQPDALSQRIYQQNLSKIAVLERQKAVLEKSDPLMKGSWDHSETNARIAALRDSLDSYHLHKKMAAANEPEERPYRRSI